jgi:hypothetical protein
VGSNGGFVMRLTCMNAHSSVSGLSVTLAVETADGHRVEICEATEGALLMMIESAARALAAHRARMKNAPPRA